MSRLVDNISKIHNNPFVLTPLIIGFYNNTEPRPNDILLAYLILPLVLHEESKHSLAYAKVTSSTQSFKRKKENLYGLAGRVESYKDLTNKCIQYAIDNKYIKINKNLSVEVIKKEITTIGSLEKSLRASSNLHKVFRDLDVVSIYRLLGVKEL